MKRAGIFLRPWERDLIAARLNDGDRLGAQRVIVAAVDGTIVTRWTRSGFREIDVDAERARLADLGSRIAATRAAL